MTDLEKRIDEVMEKAAQEKEQPLTKMLLDASIKFSCRPSDLCINQQDCGDTIKFWIGRIPENIVDERSHLIQHLQAQLAERDVMLAEMAESLEKIVAQTTEIVDGGFTIDGVGNIAFEALQKYNAMQQKVEKRNDK